MNKLTESILNNFDIMREKAFMEAEPSIDTDTLAVTSDINTKSRDKINNLFAWISDHAVDGDLEYFLNDNNVTIDQFENPNLIPDDEIDDLEIAAKDWIGDHIADEDISGLKDQGIDLESENLNESVEEYIDLFRKAVNATDTRSSKRLLNSAMIKLRDADDNLYRKALSLISKDNAALEILNMLKKESSSLEEDSQKTYGKINPEENKWVENFRSKTCPHCGNEGLDLFWTDEDHSWAKSVCSKCGKVVDPYIEVGDNSDSDYEDNEESFSMYNSNTDKTVKVYKSNDGKWHDSDGNTYMGYLSKTDVKSYFKGNWIEESENLKENSDSDREQAIQCLIRATDLSREQVEKYIDKIIAANKDQKRRDYAEANKDELEKEYIKTHTLPDGSVAWGDWESFTVSKMNEAEEPGSPQSDIANRVKNIIFEIKDIRTTIRSISDNPKNYSFKNTISDLNKIVSYLNNVLEFVGHTRVNGLTDGSAKLEEDTVPASVLDFKHTELKKVQDNIALIAGLKAEEPSNELYTKLMDAYDKVQKALEDVIEEDPVGTVVTDTPTNPPVEEPQEEITEPSEDIIEEPEEEL